MVLALHALDAPFKQPIGPPLLHELADHEEHALAWVGCMLIRDDLEHTMESLVLFLCIKQLGHTLIIREDIGCLLAIHDDVLQNLDPVSELLVLELVVE